MLIADNSCRHFDLNSARSLYSVCRWQKSISCKSVEHSDTKVSSSRGFLHGQALFMTSFTLGHVHGLCAFAHTQCVVGSSLFLLTLNSEETFSVRRLIAASSAAKRRSERSAGGGVREQKGPARAPPHHPLDGDLRRKKPFGKQRRQSQNVSPSWRCDRG